MQVARPKATISVKTLSMLPSVAMFWEREGRFRIHERTAEPMRAVPDRVLGSREVLLKELTPS